MSANKGQYDEQIHDFKPLLDGSLMKSRLTPPHYKLSTQPKRSMHWVSCLFIGLLLLASKAQAEPQMLNFNQADIQSVIATVGEITGKTFVIDPRVQGQVTVISSQPLEEDELYSVFLSVLRVQGFAAISDGNVVRVVPDAVAQQQAAGNGSGGEAIVTRILPLENISATEALPLLRPLLPQTAHLVAHEASNTLIAADRAANIDRLQSIIRRIDRAEQSEVEVIPLQHASASELMRTLQMLNPNQTEIVIADERTNSLLLSGDSSRRLRVRTLISHLDTPLDAGGNTQVIHLSYATAEELVPILQGVVDQVVGGSDGAPTVEATARIQAHAETNSLIISAQPAQLRSLQSVIRSLDIPRAQVLVEAIIAEVTLDTARELGIQWQATSNLADGDGLIGGTNFGTGGNNILSQVFNPIGSPGAIPPGPGLNLGYLAGTTSILGNEILELGAVLRALSTDSDSNVLSTPSIVTMDNAEASISVGQEVPFITGQFTNTSVDTAAGQVNPFQTINREEVGILLTVTPKINEGDSVILTIQQEVSSLLPAVGAVDLITSKRTLSTQVMVRDNDILVLGGLISDDLQETEDRVPGLGNIPVLGELFKFRSNRQVKRNLMVFIRPRILRDPNLSRDISTSKYNFIRARQLEQRANAQGLTPEGEIPLLPELYEYLQTSPELLQPQEDDDL